MAEGGHLVERSEASARNAIMDAFVPALQGVESEYRDLVNEELLTSALELAWRFQFDDDRTAIRRRLKEAVSDRVAEWILGEDD